MVSIVFKKSTSFFILVVLFLQEKFAYFNSTAKCINYQKFSINSTNNQIFMNTTYDLNSQLNDLKTYLFVSSSVVFNCNTTFTVFMNTTKASSTNTVQTLLVNFKNVKNSLSYIIAFPIISVNSTQNFATINELLADFAMNGNEFGMVAKIDQNENYFVQVLKTYSFSGASQNAVLPTNCLASFDNTNSTIIINPTKLFRFNCLIAQGNSNLYVDYKRNLISYNWAFWFAVCVVLISLVISNYVNDELPYDEKLKDNYLTHHPFYSLHYCASRVIFTPRMRLGIMTLAISAMGWFNGLMVYLYIQIDGEADVNFGIRLAVFGVFGAIFSQFFAFLGGLFAYWYYSVQKRFVNNYKRLESHQEREAEIERYEIDTFEKEHIFYFFHLLFGMFFLIMPIWFLFFKTLENQGFWLLQIVISFGFKYLVFDVVLVFIAKLGCFNSFMKLWGYWFDYSLHEEFKMIYKLN